MQIFAPGIPQIYYVGLLAGENDIQLLEKTKEGRDINRHYYELAEIKKQVNRPVVKSLIKLLEFRNSAAAFDLDGSIDVATPSDHEIVITRMNKAKTDVASDKVDFQNLTYQVKYNDQVFGF